SRIRKHGTATPTPVAKDTLTARRESVEKSNVSDLRGGGAPPDAADDGRSLYDLLAFSWSMALLTFFRPWRRISSSIPVERRRYPRTQKNSPGTTRVEYFSWRRPARGCASMPAGRRTMQTVPP